MAQHFGVKENSVKGWKYAAGELDERVRWFQDDRLQPEHRNATRLTPELTHRLSQHYGVPASMVRDWSFAAGILDERVDEYSP